MGKIITWTMENYPPATTPGEANNLFYAKDVVRYQKFRSRFSIKYCRRNKIRYIVGNQSVDVPAGSLFVVNDDTELECLPCQPDTEALAVFFTKDLLYDVQHNLSKRTETLLDEPQPPNGNLGFFEHVYHQNDALNAQLNAISQQVATMPEGDRDDCSTDLFFSLAENLFTFQHQTLIQINAINARSPATRQELFRRVLAAHSFMLDQWDEPLNLDDIAHHVFLSPFHFHRIFRGVYGESPMRWFKKTKLERARNLLAGGGLDVTEVAFRCGFSDLASFSKAFKKEWGFCPSKVKGDF